MLRWLEGFEAVAATVDLQRKYSSVVVAGIPQTGEAARNGVRGYGRNGGNNGSQQLITPSFGNQGTIITGLGVFLRSLAAAAARVLEIRDNGTVQWAMNFNSTTGRLQITNNAGAILFSTDMAFDALRWYFVEWKVVFHGTTGSMQIRVDGAVQPITIGTLGGSITGGDTFAGDTTNTANNYADQLVLAPSSNSSAHWYDDWYICDGQGTENNDFLGDVKVVGLFPTAEGTYSDFTPSTGTNNALNVDETAPDGDTTYNSSATPGHKDTFALGDLPAGVSEVLGVAQTIVFRKDDAGSRTVRTLVRSGGTDDPGPTVAVSDSFTSTTRVMGTNPVTSAEWTISEVNALEAGYEVVT